MLIEKTELTSWKILLVCKDEKEALPHFSVSDDSMKLLSRFVNSVAVLAVDDENQSLGARVIVSPQRPDLVLPAHILYRNKQAKADVSF